MQQGYTVSQRLKSERGDEWIGTSERHFYAETIPLPWDLMRMKTKLLCLYEWAQGQNEMPIRCDILKAHEITRMIKMERKKFKDSIGWCVHMIWGTISLHSKELHFSRSYHHISRRNILPFRDVIQLWEPNNLQTKLNRQCWQNASVFQCAIQLRPQW